MQLKGQLVDILSKQIYPAEISLQNKKITAIRRLPDAERVPDHYIMPGFIDAHIHIESSMLVPSEFARLAVVHGTVATVSDPHEIANVCGMEGVSYMIENGKSVPFKFFFGAPSCVPATPFETAGASITVNDVKTLLEMPDIHYLSEMMNFPGVLNKDPEVMKKIAVAQKMGKPVDGHAPGLMGSESWNYISAYQDQVVISTDHECFTKEEALNKLKLGMKILIREGSAARNFDALADLLSEYPDHIMFCSDDKHPDSLVKGHINELCARAVAKQINVFNVLKAACINPVQHYQLNVGLLKAGDPADFIVVRDLNGFEILQTYIEGQLVAENGRSLISSTGNAGTPINHFNCQLKNPDDLRYEATTSVYPHPLIEAFDGQLITGKTNGSPLKINGYWESDPSEDILKIIVVNRYKTAAVAKAFIKNIGLKEGAIASSVAHDSHNIVAIGTDDRSLCKAVNLIIDQKGGVSCVSPNDEKILPLPVAGLMSRADGYEVASAYTTIDEMAKKNGSTLAAPFMTLSFMALLVIPHLKLSDLGLFDGDTFKLLPGESA